MINQSTVIGFSGSVRSNYKGINKLEEIVETSDNLSELKSNIKKQPLKFSNTDIIVAGALLGAKSYGSKIKFMSLVELFRRVDYKIFNYPNGDANNRITEIDNIDTLLYDEEQFNKFLENISTADGIILGSPVYFGDRSSVANKVLQVTNKNNLLFGKAFGSVSVGAKRNGGQETTNIYAIYEALMQDAIAVGNGPETSQYGGAAVAGDPGKVLSDDLGLETSYGTGQRVATLATILKNGLHPKLDKDIKISVFLTMDNAEGRYIRIISDYFKDCKKHLHINILNLTDYTIYRCTGCMVCPSPSMIDLHKNQTLPYNCLIQSSNDSLKYLRKILVGSDCIVIVGVNSLNDLVYRYQVFMERTRFIRHNDFELTNTPIVGLKINEIGANNNPLHNIKVLTSYIRHNTFILKPLELIYHENQLIYKDDFDTTLKFARQIQYGRSIVPPSIVSFKARGYEDKRLDDTEIFRK